MAVRRFDIIFDGSISDGHNIDEVKQNLQQLFTLDAATIEKLFSGNPVAIKKNLERKEAQQYQAALSKAGAKIQLVLNRHEQTEAPDHTSAEKTNDNIDSTTPKAQQEIHSLQALPVGSNLLEAHERPIATPVTVSIDHLKTVQTATFGAQDLEPPPSTTELLSGDAATTTYPSNHNIPENGSFTLADLNDAKVYQTGSSSENANTIEVDIDHLSLSELSTDDGFAYTLDTSEIETLELNINFELLEAGADLLEKNEKKHYEAAEIDTSALTLSDPI